MRKFQQLALLLLSCFCIIVLLFYKTENNRLKYVLRVVNFFGRNDEIILHQIEQKAINVYINYGKPIPVWQTINSDFHAYSSYWTQNDLLSGGEAITLVVGNISALVKFRCALLYDGGSRIYTGKFSFRRLGEEFDASERNFVGYNFHCRVAKNFGNPDYVTYSNPADSQWNYKLKLRAMKTNGNKTSLHTPMTVCIDMATDSGSTDSKNTISKITQFFHHHKLLGINDYIVYNGDELDDMILIKLFNQYKGLQVHLLPFNFPVHFRGTGEYIREFITIDCLRRTAYQTKVVLILHINEFFYPSTLVNSNNAIEQILKNHGPLFKKFDLTTFSVCIDENKKLMLDNNFYDPKLSSKEQISIYQIEYLEAMDANKGHSAVTIPLLEAFAHHYINCHNLSRNSMANWRTKLNDNYTEFLEDIRSRISHVIV